MLILKMLVFMLLLIPLMIFQLGLIILGGWAMDKYSRPNVIYAVMDKLKL
jgi:hypothetical protein